MEPFIAMDSGSANEVENPLVQWNHTLLYTMDTRRECKERQDPLSPTDTARDAMPNAVLNESGAFPMPDLLDYFPEEFTCVAGLSMDDTYCYTNSLEESNAYVEEVNFAESSDQPDLWLPELQAGTELQSQPGFDFTPIEMTPRKLTQSPTPISSADVFDGSSIPTWFENMAPNAELSPLYSTFSSQSSFSSDMNRSPSTSARRHSEHDPRPNTLAEPIPTPERSASSSQILPASNNTRPHRCTYRGCTRSYARKFELYRHQRRHTGIKPHHCQVPGCDRGPQNGFYRKDHLRQHMKQVHFV